MKYLFETTRGSLTPADFIQDQNNQFEESQDDFDFLPIDDFDPLEVL
jgi:hypothetical protein